MGRYHDPELSSTNNTLKLKRGVMKYWYILILYPFLVYSQSEIVTDSRFAARAELIYTVNNNFTGRGVDFGFSLFNFIDIGFEHLGGSYNSQYHTESSATTIYAAYNAKSKNYCFRLLAGYSLNTVKYYSENLNLYGAVIGLIFYSKIYETESVSLIPGIGFSAGLLSVSQGSRYSNYSEIENPKSAGFEFNIVSKINNRFYFVIDPSLSKDLVNTDNSLILGINLGIIFRIPNK